MSLDCCARSASLTSRGNFSEEMFEEVTMVIRAKDMVDIPPKYDMNLGVQAIVYHLPSNVVDLSMRN